MPDHIHVAAAAIFNERGEVLLSLRPEHAHQGGLWEFPGGKLEAGEDVRVALRRELGEELGIEPDRARPLIRVRHEYPDRAVLLDVWRVDRYRGRPHGHEGQRLEWVDPERLGEWEMPAADEPVVNAVRLPATYLVTGGPQHEPEEFLRRLGRSLAAGVRLVQLRAKGLDEPQYLALARAAVPLCRAHGARVLLNSDPKLAELAGADGVHLSSARLLSLRRRPLSRAKYWVAASCHKLEELRQAQRIGADFVVVSPVLPTASHPEREPLGWDGLRALTECAVIPVYALGGMTPVHLERAHDHGAQGIAAIRSLWKVAG